MASKSVATMKSASVISNKHDLWIGDYVLTVSVGRALADAGAQIEQCQKLNHMIKGLSHAAKNLLRSAGNDSTTDMEFDMEPVVQIQDAILLLSQFSNAITSELARAEPQP